MTTLSIRGLDDETAQLLKQAAQNAGSSVNTQVVELIRRGLGVEPGRGRLGRYRDLDHLAGTWSDDEAAAFASATAAFEEVDEELWR